MPFSWGVAGMSLGCPTGSGYQTQRRGGIVAMGPGAHGLSPRRRNDAGSASALPLRRAMCSSARPDRNRPCRGQHVTGLEALAARDRHARNPAGQHSTKLRIGCVHLGLGDAFLEQQFDVAVIAVRPSTPPPQVMIRLSPTCAPSGAAVLHGTARRWRGVATRSSGRLQRYQVRVRLADRAMEEPLRIEHRLWLADEDIANRFGGDLGRPCTFRMTTYHRRRSGRSCRTRHDQNGLVFFPVADQAQVCGLDLQCATSGCRPGGITAGRAINV